MAVKITTAAGERPVVWLYEDIGAAFGGVSADEFRQVLGTIPAKEPIDLRINSGGGIFTESIAIFTNLRQRKGSVFVYVDGLAASGASIVAMAGKSIEMARGSWLMVHEARALGEGKASDMRKAADRLEAINRQLIDIYSPRWKGTQDELVAALAEETWLTEDQAVEMGLADVVSEQMAAAARVDPEKFQYKAAPQRLVDGMFPKREMAAAAYADLEKVIANLKTEKELEACVLK